jgi:hypothetical protein
VALHLLKHLSHVDQPQLARILLSERTKAAMSIISLVPLTSQSILMSETRSSPP